MLIVLADDFSGAAEIGGIAHRYGLRAEVQLQFNPASEADILVVDTDTRLMEQAAAVRKLTEVSLAIREAYPSGIKLFKKVDSVMRGHIVPEINALKEVFNYRRIFLLPANPARGRKIIGGNYFVGDTSLDKSVFGSDPDYPITSSSIKVLLEGKGSNLPHVHAASGASVPAGALVTGDVSSPEDFYNYLRYESESDLCCGAAEFFEAWLAHHGHKSNKATQPGDSSRKYTLVINGSTVKIQEEINMLQRLNIPRLPLPGEWQGNKFILEGDEFATWQLKVLEMLRRHRTIVVVIDLPVKPIKGIAEIFSGYFVALIDYISAVINSDGLRIGLTGGATASSIIRARGLDGLTVVEEIAPGVVTLGRSRGENGRELYTVKPGSYPWPGFF